MFQTCFHGLHFLQMHVRIIGLIHPALERIWTKEGADSCGYRTIADKIFLWRSIGFLSLIFPYGFEVPSAWRG